MAITLYTGNTKEPPVVNWVDFNTVKNAQCIAANLILLSKINFVREAPLTNPYVFAANVPLRVWNVITALKDKRYWQVALDVLAFSSLLFPLYGVKAAIFIDLASEVKNVYIKMHQNDPTHHSFFFWNWLNWGGANIKPPLHNENDSHDIDCTIRENALRVLGLSAKEAEDRGVLDERYEDMCKLFKYRIVKARKLKSEPVAKEIEKRLRRVQIAYDTLKP